MLAASLKGVTSDQELTLPKHNMLLIQMIPSECQRAALRSRVRQVNTVGFGFVRMQPSACIANRELLAQ